jgi:hypothetical protein
MTNEMLVYAALGIAVIAGILYYKGYFVLPRLNTPARKPAPQSGAKAAFDAAVRLAVTEAQEESARRLSESLHAQAVEHLANPLPGAGVPPGAGPPAAHSATP